MSCAQISAAVPINCNLVDGLRAEMVWIGNEDDFAPTSDATGVFTVLAPVASAKVYGFGGARNSVTYDTEPVADSNLQKHTLNFAIMAYTAAAKVQANKLNQGGRFFAIAKRNDGQYIVLGMGSVGTTTSTVNMIGSATEGSDKKGIACSLMHMDGLGDISLPPIFLPTGGIDAWMTANAVIV